MLPGGIADQRSYVIPSSDVVTLSVQGPTQNLDPTANLNVTESYFNKNCLLFNARSVVANLSDFHYTLYNCNYDIGLVTETWLTEGFTNGLLDPESKYDIVRHDRLFSVGGGVCIAIRHGLKYVGVCCSTASNVEMSCIDVVYGNCRFRFIAVYRPPQYGSSAKEYVNKLVESLELLCQVAWPVIIVGDLNCPGINWQSNSSPLDGVQDKLLDCIVEFGFTQCVELPTRGSNILDLILVNEPSIMSALSVLDPDGNSDHCSVHFCITADSKSHTGTDNKCTDVPVVAPHYMWQQADYEGISSYLSQVDWQSIMSHNLTPDLMVIIL